MDTFLEQFNLIWGSTLLGGMTGGQLIAGALILLGFLVIRKLFARFVISRLKKFTEGTKTDLDNKILKAIEEPLKFIPIVIGVFVFANYFSFGVEVSNFLFTLVRSLLAFTMFWATYNILTPTSEFLENFLANLTKDSKTLYAEEYTGLIVKFLKVMTIAIGGIIILSQWGINVLPLLTGLGIAGMAVAFAAKDTIENVFSGIKLITDGAYRRGEWIETPSVEGTVTEIGIATTKIRTFAKALQVVPNRVLASEPITNWSRMTYRRIKMSIGVEYRTPSNVIENIIDRIRLYLEENSDIAQPGTDAVVQMVHLEEFAGSSINFNLYYFTKTTKWGEWRRIKHENMLAFMKIIEEEGAAFAFPSQSVYLETMPGVDTPDLDDPGRKVIEAKDWGKGRKAQGGGDG